MRNRVMLLAFVAAMGLAIGTYGLLAQPSENAAIEQLMRQITDVYNKKDLATYEKICDPKVLIMEEGVKTVGWVAVREVTVKEWESLTDFNWDVGIIQVHFVGKDFAWATSEGSFKGKMKDGTQSQGPVMESCIFQKKSGAWKLVHAHFSSLPMQK
jgi:ketosteroid isomerase-like protein